jgi:hypothetical protein
MEIEEEDIHRMKEALNGVDDPRRQWGFIRHKLLDMLVIGLCSITVRGEYFDEMEELGNAGEQWFRKFLELPNGIPDEDTFRRIFERVDPVQLLECLQQWLEQRSQSGGRDINIDGKTMRGSAKAGERKGIHMVSAWVKEHNLTLGQLATEAHSNEITAIPLLLDTIDIKTIIEYRCERTVQEETTITCRYYISSKDAPADEFGRIIRNHWSIENNLHWGGCVPLTQANG